MRTRLRAGLTLAVSLVVVMVTELPSLAVNPTPVPVKNDPNVSEYYPAASGTHLAWEQFALGHYNVYAQPRAGGAKVRVNASRRSGCCSSILPGADSIIYQQFSGSDSDLYLYDMGTEVRKILPAKVDTKAWEYWGVASSAYVAFMRITRLGRILFLYNRTSGRLTQIASSKVKCGSCFRPDWVGSTHLIYQQCSPKTFACKLWLWTKKGSTRLIPNPDGSPYSQYGGVMDEATGDIYYIRTTTWCGLFVEIRRTNTSDVSTFTTIYDFPEGIDGNELSLAPDVLTPTDTDLLFSQYDCIKNDSDILEIDSVNAL